MRACVRARALLACLCFVCCLRGWTGAERACRRRGGGGGGLTRSPVKSGSISARAAAAAHGSVSSQAGKSAPHCVTDDGVIHHSRPEPKRGIIHTHILIPICVVFWEQIVVCSTCTCTHHDDPYCRSKNGPVDFYTKDRCSASRFIPPSLPPHAKRIHATPAVTAQKRRFARTHARVRVQARAGVPPKTTQAGPHTHSCSLARSLACSPSASAAAAAAAAAVVCVPCHSAAVTGRSPGR